MRFDVPVYFQSITTGKYDPQTGNYDADTISEEMRYASVSMTGEETLKVVYGGVKQGSFVIRLQQHYRKPFNRIRIGEKSYNVDVAKMHRMKHVFIVSEVQ